MVGCRWKRIGRLFWLHGGAGDDAARNTMLRFPSVMLLIALTIFTVAYPTLKQRMGIAKYERPEDAM
jgi:hypothetical protein